MSQRGENLVRCSCVRIDDLDRGGYLSTPQPSASRLDFPARFGLDRRVMTVRLVVIASR